MICLAWSVATVFIMYRCHPKKILKNINVQPLSSFQLVDRNFPAPVAARDTLSLPVVSKSSPRTTISNKSFNWKPNWKLSVNTDHRGFFSAPTATSKFARRVFQKVTRSTKFQVDCNCGPDNRTLLAFVRICFYIISEWAPLCVMLLLFCE